MRPSQSTIDEFKAFINIIPQDDLTAIRVCYTIESFQRKYPEVYDEIMKEVELKQ